MVSSSIPFPPVSWWIYALQSEQVTFDLAEHYQKMSYRNRYYLAAPEGRLLMSLPLEHGRNQRIPVHAVQLSYRTDWQNTQWKTITSLYGRSPFFEYFEHRIAPLFREQKEYLHEWNIAGIRLICELLKLPLTFTETEDYIKEYPPETTDLRKIFKPQSEQEKEAVFYHQVFEDRTGFIPGCSILDLLFCEGMHAKAILM